MVSCKQSRTLQEFIDDNFLFQVLHRPTRGVVLLDTVLTLQKRSQNRLRLEAAWAATIMSWVHDLKEQRPDKE